MDQSNFVFEGEDVHCAEEVCLVCSKNSEVYELAGSVPEVTFDAKLLLLTGIKIPQNELELGMWVRMTWFDARLKLCSCGKTGQLDSVKAPTRTRMQRNMEDFVWTPELTIDERVHPVRREGSLLDFTLEGDEDRSGVNMSFTSHLRATVKCMYKTRNYPYNKNSCPVTIVPYSHGHDQSTKFSPRNLTRGSITYKDVLVDDCFLPREYGKGGKDGFRVILDRRGGEVMRTYEFTLMNNLVFAVLSVSFSPRNTDVSFILEAVTVAFYIDFDLYTKAPPVTEYEGGVTLLEEVTRIYYFLVFIQALVSISLRFLIRRFLDNNPLIRDKPLVKKLMQSSWLFFIGFKLALIGFFYLNYVMNSRLMNQSREKCPDAGASEH